MWRKTSSAALAITVLLLLGCSSSGDVPSYEVSFDLANADGVEYEAFLNQFNLNVDRTAGEWIDDGHPVLGEQKLTTTPDVWLSVVIKQSDTDDRVTFAVRSDNLYVSGFTNKYDERFAFLGERRKIPSSTQLSFSSGYPDLFDDKLPDGKKEGYQGLKKLSINKVEAAGHFRILSNYRAGGAGTDEALKKQPLAFFILVISECHNPWSTDSPT